MSSVDVAITLLPPPTVQVSAPTSPTVQLTMAGAQGPAGSPGIGGDLSFSQPFTAVSTVTVDHNLGKYPAVTVISSAGDEVEGDVRYTSINQVVLTFSAAFSGVVYCN